MREQTKGSLMLLVTSLIWGTAFVAQSEGMNYVQPFTYNAIRTLIGGITLIPVVILFRSISRHSGERKEFSRKNTVIGGICCGVLLFVASSFQQSGIARTTAGKAGFITALYIVIVPLLSVFMGKRPPARSWIFVGIAAVGFWLLCMKDGLTISGGDLLVLVSAFVFALHIIVIDRFNLMQTDGVMMSCIQFFTAGTLMLICMFIFEKPQFRSIIAAELSQLDRPHVVARLRLLTLKETVLFTSLNHILLGTKFYSVNSVKIKFYSSTGELCTRRNTVERRQKYRF